MKLLKKFFANIKNIKNLNKFIQIVLTFCLCFVITFCLALIFNNKFKFIEKFSHPNCNDNHNFRTYYFHGNLDSSNNINFLPKWNQLIDNSLNNDTICYIKAPKKENDLDDTYKKFTNNFSNNSTSGDILLVLGLNDNQSNYLTLTKNITYLKDEEKDNINYKINNLLNKYDASSVNFITK